MNIFLISKEEFTDVHWNFREAVLPRPNDVEMGPANSLHASAFTANKRKNLLLI